MSAEVARATRTIAGWTLASRLFGLLRDLLTARVFGDTLIGSAFMAAFVVPNVFRRLFGEGALSAAFLPVYTKALHSDDPGRSDRVASAVFASLAVITGIILILGEALLIGLILVLPESPERTLSLQLMAVTLPFMPLVCASAVLGGVLHAHGRFTPTAAAPLLLNALLIVAAVPALFFPESIRPSAVQTAFMMAVAALIAGALQLAWALLALRGRLRWTRSIAPARDDSREVMRRFGPVALGMGTLQINTLLDTFIAMVPVWIGPVVFGLTYPLDESSNGILGFTQRLYQFPLGVFGIAVATAAFPMLARAAAASDEVGFVRTLRNAIGLSLFIGLPASVGLLLVRTDLTASLFGGPGSAFSGEGLARSAAVLMGYAPAVWIYSLNHVLTRALYARGDTAGPTRAAIASMGLNVVLNLGLIWVLREAGLAWATAASALFQLVLLMRLVRKAHAGSALLDRDLVRSIARTGVLSVGMGVCVWLAMRSVELSGAWSTSVARVCVAVVIGVGVYLLGSWVVRAPELAQLLRRGRG